MEDLRDRRSDIESGLVASGISKWVATLLVGRRIFCTMNSLRIGEGKVRMP